MLTIEICLWGNVLSVDVAPWLFNEHWGVKNNILIMITIVVAGVASFAIFEWQRHCDRRAEQEGPENNEEGESLFDKVLAAGSGTVPDPPAHRSLVRKLANERNANKLDIGITWEKQLKSCMMLW